MNAMDGFAVGRKDAGDDGEEAKFDEKSHGRVEDGGGITCLLGSELEDLIRRVD